MLSTKRVRRDIFGMAGVFWVASELSRQGWVALPTIRNLKAVDIIAQHPTSSKRVDIQVKTIQGRGFWLLGKMRRKDIECERSLFFVFVRPEAPPSTCFEGFVVHSAHVQRDARQQSNRKFQFCWYPPDRAKLYRNRWDALGQK